MSTIRVVNLQHTDATEPNIVLLADGTSVFASGITISGGTNLTVSGTAEFASGTVSAPGITFIDDNNTGLYSPATDTVAITTAATERVRVDSTGNVGIGTSSPLAKVHIGAGTGGIRFGVSGATPKADIEYTNSGAEFLDIKVQGTTTGHGNIRFSTGPTPSEQMRIDSSGRLLLNGGTDVRIELGTNGTTGTNDRNHIRADGDILKYNCCDNGQHIFEENGIERMRIDGSGNVGIGITSPSDLLHLNGPTGYGLKITDGSSHIGVFRTISDGAILKTASSHALLFGTSDTERMRIDSSGRLLIGTTTEGVGDASDLTIENSSRAGLTLRSAANEYGTIAFSDATSGTGEYDGVIAYEHNNQAMRFSTNSVQRMRIDSSGKVGIGESSPGSLLHLNWAYGNPQLTLERSGNATAKYELGAFSNTFTITDAAQSQERLRIDSSGNVLIGKTSVSTAVGTGVQLIEGSAASVDVVINAASNIGVNHVYNLNATNNGYRFYIAADGGIYNHSNNNSNISDEREKKNIVDMDSTWSDLKQWTLRQFHFNGQEDTEDKSYGVIAQQIETVTPQVLSTFKTNPTTTRKGVKEQKMMWMAIKALQEAMVKIETLEQRLIDAGIA